MNSWEEEQENHILVRYKDSKSFLVRVTTSSTVSEVLFTACEKWGLNPERHHLEFHRDPLVEEKQNLSLIIPPNSTLDVVETELGKSLVDTDQTVLVSLQVEGTVIRKAFHKAETLSNVLNELHEACSSSKKSGEEDRCSGDSQGTKSLCRVQLKRDEKLLVLLSSGSLTLEQEHFDSTSLQDFSEEEHIFLTFMKDDLEDVPLLDDEHEDTPRSNDNSLPLLKQERLNLSHKESEITVDKVKRLLEDKGKSSQSLTPLSNQPLLENQLFKRYGLVYRLGGGNESSTDLLQTREEHCLGVFSESWISVSFENGLALQACFDPAEFVEDVKSYVSQYLDDSTAQFSLTHNGSVLDEKGSIFSSGLAPSATLTIAPVSPKDDNEEESEEGSSGHIIYNIDPRFTENIVTHSVAAATALTFSQNRPDIMIESEIYRPKSEETNWERVKIPNK